MRTDVRPCHRVVPMEPLRPAGGATAALTCPILIGHNVPKTSPQIQIGTSQSGRNFGTRWRSFGTRYRDKTTLSRNRAFPGRSGSVAGGPSTASRSLKTFRAIRAKVNKYHERTSSRDARKPCQIIVPARRESQECPEYALTVATIVSGNGAYLAEARTTGCLRTCWSARVLALCFPHSLTHGFRLSFGGFKAEGGRCEYRLLDGRGWE
jgi:hypothetical protein